MLLGCSGNGDERVSVVLDTKGSDDKGRDDQLVNSTDGETEVIGLLVVSSGVFDSGDDRE